MAARPIETEFVVVGAGLLGLAAARSLARRGREVVVLEADAVGHDRSGSKGTARIFRYGYEDPFYVRMAMAAEPLWAELERESGTTLLVHTGQLDFGTGIAELHDALRACRAPVGRLPGAEVERRFPSLGRRPALEEPASGVLIADRCLAALRQGVEVQEGLEVTALAVEPSPPGAGERVLVRASGPDGERRYRAACAVVCAGARTGDLARAGVAVPPQRSTLEQVAYLAIEEGLPVVIDRSEQLLYGLPDPERQAYKVGLHHAGPEAEPRTAGMEDDARLLAELRAAAGTTIPGWGGTLVASERCLYDSTANEDFVLDRAGPVVVGCGTSGHGFKFGPLLGEHLAELATTGSLPDELARFRLSR
jgi:sarcosine oxidase